MSKELFNIFLNSGLHGGHWPRDVFCVAVLKVGGAYVKIVERNDNGCHAEENMIKRLQKKLLENSLCSQTVALFVNFSPCVDCSDRILSFVRQAKLLRVEVDLRIYFPCLYKVRRPSCKSGLHSRSHRLPSELEHSENVRGLRKLRENGVHLSVFSQDHWSVFADLLDLEFLYHGSARQREDRMLKRDFEQVMEEDTLEDLLTALLRRLLMR